LYTFRLKRLAAAIDMICAGTRPSIAIAASAKPASAAGSVCSKSAWTMTFAPYEPLGRTAAAIAMYPSSASRSSITV